MLRKIFFPMLAILVMVGSARAADEPTRVQLLSMMVPLIDEGGRKAGNTPLTVILEAKDKKAATDACKQSIYIRDALLESLYGKPLVRRAGKVDVDGGKAQVIDVANRILGSKGISNAYLVDASQSMGGGGIARLPFTSVLGCKDLDSKMNKKPKDGEGKDAKKDGDKKGGH